MKTLFLHPPSFDGFDGGAGSRLGVQRLEPAHGVTGRDRLGGELPSAAPYKIIGSHRSSLRTGAKISSCG